MAAESSRRLRLETIDEVTVVSFVDPRLVDDLVVQEVGDELYSLVEKHGHRKLVLNFGNVQNLSSNTLGMLAALKNKAVKAGGDIRLCQIHADLMLPFTVTGLDRKLKILKDEQAAIESF